MQPERKRKGYQPFPGLYDLRLFDLDPKQFEAAWRVQECLYLSLIHISEPTRP